MTDLLRGEMPLSVKTPCELEAVGLLHRFYAPFAARLHVPLLFGAVLVKKVSDARGYAYFNSALITDALANITDNPYESSDALATRITTISALHDVLAAFGAPGLPSPDDLDALARRRIDLPGSLFGGQSRHIEIDARHVLRPQQRVAPA